MYSCKRATVYCRKLQKDDETMLFFYIYSKCVFNENIPSIWGNAVSVGEGIVSAGGSPPKVSFVRIGSRNTPFAAISFTTGVSIS